MEQLWRNFGDVLPMTLVGLPVATLLAWAVARRRACHVGRREAWRLAALDVLLMMAALPVVYLVLVPVGGGYHTPVSLVPGADLLRTNDEISVWRLVGNLLLLTPLGALAPLRWHRLRSMARMALAAGAVAVGIEAAQWVLPVGRVVSFDDALLNCAGAVMGALASRMWWRTPASTSATAVRRVAEPAGPSPPVHQRRGPRG